MDNDVSLAVREIVADVKSQDPDSVGKIFPELNNGQKAMAYGAIAFGSHLATPAWIAMGLFWWPATWILFSGGMTVHFLAKSLRSPKKGSQEYAPAANEPQQPSIGPVTQLTAVDVLAEAEPVYEVNPFLKTNRERYEGPVYSSPEDKEAAESSKPSAPMKKFRAPNVNELLALPIEKRAEKLLDDLALSGCDLRGLIHDPIVAVTGEQQSGKSTLLVILSVLESALLGKKIHYATTDSDIYPFKFASVVDSSEDYRQEVENVSQLTKGNAGGHSWLFDELTKQDRENITQPLWSQLLTGFVKTRASARLVIHGKTLSAMGVPTGFNEQAKQEATIIRAKRQSEVVSVSERRSLAFGGRYPSGQYAYLDTANDKLSDSEDLITLPDWLQFELNDEGNPCYVRSLLTYFPELQGMVEPMTYATPETSDNFVLETARDALNVLWSNTAAVHPIVEEVKTDDSGIESNAEMFANSVKQFLTDKELTKITLAQLLANCYELKKYLRLASHDEAIREKGRQTARILTKKSASMGLLDIEERGQSITIRIPQEPLFTR